MNDPEDARRSGRATEKGDFEAELRGEDVIDPMDDEGDPVTGDNGSWKSGL